MLIVSCFLVSGTCTHMNIYIGIEYIEYIYMYSWIYNENEE